MKYLNTTRKIPVILFVALTLIVGGLSGCAGGDMATVTISIGNYVAPVSERTPLLDRILAVFTFAREANAQPAPWSFELTITGPGMIPITREVPDDTMTLTLDIPSGSARVFTAVAYLGSTRTYGGIVTRETFRLAKTSQFPSKWAICRQPPTGLNPVRTSNQEEVPFNYVSWDGGDLSTVTGYYVYRSSSRDWQLCPNCHGT